MFKVARIPSRCGLLALTTSLCVSSTWAQVAIQGTSVSMEPPAGFSRAGSFAGFQNTEDGSSITIAEFSRQTYREVSEAFSSVEAASRVFAAQRVSFLRRTVVTAENTEVPVLIGTQTAAGVEVGKYIALFAGERTVVVTFNIFDRRRVREEAVLAALASVRLAGAPTLEEKLGHLSFEFRIEPPFRVFDVILGAAVALTGFDGTDPSGRLPFIAIERVPGMAEEENLVELSELLLRNTEGFSPARITRREVVRFAGGDGYLIEATGGELAVVQYVRIPPDGRYLRLFARGAEDELPAVMSAVVAIADSVVIRD